MDRSEFINALGHLVRDAARAGLPADDIIAGLESALRCERRERRRPDEESGYEPVGLSAIGAQL